jgi:drug/metabolite transporter (DMT)-like permease
MLSRLTQATPALLLKSHGDKVALASFVGGAFLGGGNAVAIRYSNRELAPLWGAGLRFSLAASIFIVIMAILRQPLPRGRALIGALLYGLFNFGLSFALAYYALLQLHAGLAQTLLAVVPLMTLLLAVIYRQERLRVPAIAGTLLALAGIAVVSRAPLQNAVPLLSLLAALGAAFCFAQAGVIVRGFPRLHPVTMNAVGMTTAAALLLAGAALTGESLVLPKRAETWLAIAYIVPVGSVLVFWLALLILKYWAASRAAYVFVLIPVFTILLSAWLDHERVGWGLLLGALLVLAGVYIGALRPVRPS